jgi:hypothetical protein
LWLCLWLTDSHSLVFKSEQTVITHMSDTETWQLDEEQEGDREVAIYISNKLIHHVDQQNREDVEKALDDALKDLKNPILHKGMFKRTILHTMGSILELITRFSSVFKKYDPPYNIATPESYTQRVELFIADLRDKYRWADEFEDEMGSQMVASIMRSL